MNNTVSQIASAPRAILRSVKNAVDNAGGTVSAALLIAAVLVWTTPTVPSNSTKRTSREIHNAVVVRLHEAAESSAAPTLDTENQATDGQAAATQDDATIRFMSDAISDFGHDDESAQGLAEAILKESRGAELDPLLIAAVVKYESSFKAHATSHRGARGLMQVMPATEKAMMKTIDTSKLSAHERQLRLGSQYLAELNKRFRGNMYHSLIAYNWGPTNLSVALRSGSAIPSGPVSYARRILAQQASWSGAVQKHSQVG